MSIDIQIIPMHEERISIRELTKLIEGEFGGIEIRKSGEDNANNSERYLERGCFYQVISRDGGNIVIYVNNIDDEDTDYEDDVLEEYARNITEQECHEIANGWKKAGYYYFVTSTSLRTPMELRIQQLISANIAILTSGYVVVANDDIFDLPIGLHDGKTFLQH